MVVGQAEGADVFSPGFQVRGQGKAGEPSVTFFVPKCEKLGG